MSDTVWRNKFIRSYYNVWITWKSWNQRGTPSTVCYCVQLILRLCMQHNLQEPMLENLHKTKTIKRHPSKIRLELLLQITSSIKVTIDEQHPKTTSTEKEFGERRAELVACSLPLGLRSSRPSAHCTGARCEIRIPVLTACGVRSDLSISVRGPDQTGRAALGTELDHCELLLSCDKGIKYTLNIKPENYHHKVYIIYLHVYTLSSYIRCFGAIWT